MSIASIHGSTDGRIPLGVSDQPIENKNDDWLSLSREACALADFVAQCVTPLTIAVQGDWGSGKTSLLRMIEEHLKSGNGPPVAVRGKIEVIRFETWQYAQFGGGPALPLSLLSMLARRLSPPGKLAPIANALKRLARPAANAALRAASLGASELDDYDLNTGDVDFAEQCDTLRNELELAIRNKTENGVERIVVLIDDLDRIEPSLAIDILQTIKMFLDLKHCVFILALDFSVVKDGVQAKFGIKDDRKARAFFDKIIQLPFQVPVAKYDVGGFIRHMVLKLGEPGLDDETNALESLSRASITANPRAIKRVMNSLHLTRIIAADTFDRLGSSRTAGLVALFGLLCLQTRFPEAYDWLLTQEDTTAALRELGKAKPDGLPAISAAIAFADLRDHDDFPAFAELMIAHADKLSRDGFAKVLAITRSTSVGEQATPYRFSAELHVDNRALMLTVLNACRDALPEVAITMGEVGRREGVRLTAEPQLGVMLTLEHSKSWLGLSVETAAATRGAVLAVLREARTAADGTIHVWNAGVHETTPMWKREDRLQEAPQRFAAAWHALNEVSLAV